MQLKFYLLGMLIGREKFVWRIVFLFSFFQQNPRWPTKLEPLYKFVPKQHNTLAATTWFCSDWKTPAPIISQYLQYAGERGRGLVVTNNFFLNFSIRFKDSMGLMGGNMRKNTFQTLSHKMVLICLLIGLLIFAIQPVVGNKCPHWDKLSLSWDNLSQRKFIWGMLSHSWGKLSLLRSLWGNLYKNLLNMTF